MENEQKIKVALVRGDSLNEWEGKLWEGIGDEFAVTGFASEKNLYNEKNLNYPAKRLPTSSDNFIVSNLKKYSSGVFQEMKGLEKELENFDIAHTAELSYNYTLQAVRAKETNKRLKVVTTVWDNSFGRFEYNYWPGLAAPPKYWREKINNIMKENIKGVDLFLPVTKYSAEMLLDYSVEEKKIRILSPAVIPSAFSEVNDILEKYELKEKEFYLSVCRMVKEKGIYDILYGWRMYCRKNKSNKKLLLIGDGPEKDNLIRLIGELGLVQSVFYAGNLPNVQVRNLYKHAKGLILASLPGSLWQEQFGYVLAEAITADCPVISTYSGAIPEVIENAGLLFSPGNPVDLCDKLVRFDDDNVYKDLSDNCRLIKNKFAVEVFQKKLVEIYKDLL